jgi:hypothetical protein
LYPRFVKAPTTEAEITKAMGPYTALGLNGCLGSTDAVHIWWGMCPTSKSTVFTGKEGYPTIVFNVTCTHDGAATHVGTGTYGSCNDKTLIQFDQFVADMRTLGIYRDREYDLFTADGGTVTVKGVYVVVDGGYHQWRATMSASRFRSDPKFVRCVFLLLPSCLRIGAGFIVAGEKEDWLRAAGRGETGKHLGT